MAQRLLILMFAFISYHNATAETPLWRENIALIPCPQQATLTTTDFIFDKAVKLDQDKDATPADNFADRERAFDDLVRVWEKTRLPKGLCTAEKKYFHRQDRHFANRRADMSYLIYDEQLLDLEGYLTELRSYTPWFQKKIVSKNKSGQK